MTTIGVRADPPLRALPMKIPSYSYQYPSLRKVQLAAVKHGLYHPRIPTFRRMDMDTAAHKLPDDHCRTTTFCTPTDFVQGTTTVYAPPEQRLACLGITATAKNLHRAQTAPDNTKKTREDWSDFLNRSPERFNIQLPQLPRKDQLHFQGYAVRYLKPEITSSWKWPIPESSSGLSRRQERVGRLAVRPHTSLGFRSGCNVCTLMAPPANFDSNDAYMSVYKKHICDHQKESF